MKKKTKSADRVTQSAARDLLAENAELQRRLEEAEETLRAIREGEVDAVIVSGSQGDRVFSLTESENMHRLMVETMSEAAIATTLDGVIVYSNASLCRLLSRSSEETLGHSLFKFVNGNDAEELRSLICRAKTEDASTQLQFQHQSGAAISMYVSASLLHRLGGPIVCLVGMDLSRIEADRELIQKLNEQRELLQESERRFRSVLDNSLDVIYRLNTQTGRFEYVSPSAAHVVGYSPDELMQLDAEAAHAMIHPDDLPAMHAALARLQETGTAATEYRQQRKNGGYRWLANSMALIKDGNGCPVFRDGSIRDITERKMADVELRKLYDQTQADAVAKTQLLNEVNHRVKNNLIMILGLILAEKRRAAKVEDDQPRDMWGDFEGRIHGLLKVHQMLSDSHWQPIKVSRLAEQIGALVINGGDGASAQCICFSVEPSQAEVSARQAANLAIVFNELITNSLKHAFGNTGHPAVKINCRIDGNRLRIEFKDNGCGFPPDVLEEKRFNVGIRLIRQIIEETLDGEMLFINQHGAMTLMVLTNESSLS
jgi:PAS domain S-box-containing protein